MTSLDLPSSNVFLSLVVSTPLSIQKECLFLQAAQGRLRRVQCVSLRRLFSEFAVLSERLDQGCRSLRVRKNDEAYVDGVHVIVRNVRTEQLRLLIQSLELLVHGAKSNWQKESSSR